MSGVWQSVKVSLRRKRDDDAVISHVCGCPWLTRGGQRAIKGAADEDLGGNPPLRIPSIQGVRGGGKYSGEGIDPACLFSVPQQLSSRSPRWILVGFDCNTSNGRKVQNICFSLINSQSAPLPLPISLPFIMHYSPFLNDFLLTFSSNLVFRYG